MASSIIELKNAGIYQGDRLILSEVNLSLKAGELAFLIGKTGAGKSSLLKTVYGQLPLMLGAGSILGFDLAQMSEKELPKLRRQLGIIFQEFHLLNDRDVYENLNFVLKATGWRKKKQREFRIIEVLTQVGLEDKIHQMPFQISGGEQQRLVIARAILNQPKLIIADEPTGNLDPTTSAEIMDLLIGLQKNSDTAILLATHDYQMIRQYPGRLLKCEAGALSELSETMS